MNRDVPVGIMLPYTRGNSGYFQQTYSDIERAHTNLKMLLMTAKGERPMMPTYGSDLRSLLFNPGEDEYDGLLVDAVHEAADKWMPEISVISVSVDREIDTAPNTAVLYITFIILSIPGSREELELEVS
jgi:phage baseplate assembly protein W|tara:strand:+ start:2033 stop:2419 length:387 start_codon:yes stop_codon:yes gene_type:complete